MEIRVQPQELVISLHLAGTRDLTQVLKLGGKRFHPLNHRYSPGRHSRYLEKHVTDIFDINAFYEPTASAKHRKLPRNHYVVNVVKKQKQKNHLGLPASLGREIQVYEDQRGASLGYLRKSFRSVAKR